MDNYQQVLELQQTLAKERLIKNAMLISQKMNKSEKETYIKKFKEFLDTIDDILENK